MATAIRLKRNGRKKQASYRIIVIDSRRRRDGRPIEDLGYFNPHTDDVKLNKESFDKWISVGAQPSERVQSIVKKMTAAA